MSVRKKIIISLIAMLSILSVVIALFFMLGIRRLQQSNSALLEETDYGATENVRRELLNLARSISSYTVSLEQEIEDKILNAAIVLFEADRMAEGNLTIDEIIRLKELTGMSDFYLSGTDGIITLSTDRDGGNGISLFDVNDDYRMLLTGEHDFMVSDLSMKTGTGEIYKAVLIPRADGRGIIEVSLEVGVLERHLQNFITTNKGVRSMNLFDSNLLTLTENRASRVQPVYTKGSYVPAGTTDIDTSFIGVAGATITFDENNARVYYPVVSDGIRSRYVLFVDFDTSSYFETSGRLGSAMEEQIGQISSYSVILLTLVFPALLVFASIISVVINRIMRKGEEQAELVAEQNRTIMESINYASNIQRNLLPDERALPLAFEDSSVIWDPRDVVGGDIYWLRQFERGVVLCVADCTGHGTPGALLTTLVASALDSIVCDDNCFDTADIIFQLDRKLSSVLHADSIVDSKRSMLDICDGCDIAVFFVAGDGSVRFSSGNVPVFVCDGTDVTMFRGQRIFVGEGKLKDKSKLDVIDIPANPLNKYYAASDGLFDQKGSVSGMQYGYGAFKDIILKHHNERLDVITARVWEAYELHRGDEPRRDDFELVAFKP